MLESRSRLQAADGNKAAGNEAPGNEAAENKAAMLAGLSTAAFLRWLRGLGVELRVKDSNGVGKLALSAPQGVVTQAMQEQLRRRKAELMELLRAGGVDAEQSAPLTFAQQRLWLIDRFAPGNAAYNIPQAWLVDEAVDVEAFRGAVQRLVERHASLRTRIEMREGVPVQVVLGQVAVPIAMVDLTRVEQDELEAGISEHLQRAGREPFLLDEAPLIRFQLLLLPQGRTLVSYDVHHIVADQWSLEILNRELVALYSEITRGTAAHLPALTVTYAEIAQRERSESSARLHAEQLEYWHKRLEGAALLLELPFGRAGAENRPGAGYAGATLRLQMEEKLTGELRKLATRNQTTLYMVMLTTFAMLLNRYTGESDFCIGTPLTGRKRREEENLVGLFVNMLPLRCTVDGVENFQQTLKRTSGEVLADFEQGDLPFQKLVMEVHPQRSAAHSPLFQMMFALNAMGAERAGAEEVQEETLLGSAKFDLSLQIAERAQVLDFYLEYRTDLYAQEDMEQFGRHFVRLAQSIVEAPNAAAASLPLLTAEDDATFARWNETLLEFDRKATLVDLFEWQVEATPERAALYCGDAVLTFRELSDRAWALAERLADEGAGPESFVALCLDRTPDLIVAMLAILKTGAAYLPLDPKYPLERLQYMLEDSGAELLVTQRGATAERLRAGVRAVYAEDVRDGRDSLVAARRGATPVAAAENAAYLIYTSGSTGKPKGVVVEHRNAVSLIAWARTQFDEHALRGMLASTSVCFDLSIFEIFLPLATGNAIVLMRDVLELASSPLAGRVTLVNTVPSAMSAVLQARLPASVNTVCLAGEFLAPELVDRIYGAGVERVFDLYGPTETTTYSTCVLRRSGEAATIGGPIANTRIYLLDQERKPVPPGAAGEIYIGGEGVTRGYLGRPELTEERFVRTVQQGRLYRTGDMARQRQDGMLVFLGRRDQQVKLRGHRIELGEVEAALREASGIAEVAVVVQAREAGEMLAAFLESAPGAGNDVREWTEALRRRLPAFMVPAAIAAVWPMPRTPNGKIDRQALCKWKEPLQEAGHADAAVKDAPRDLLEQWLANIWSYRLGVRYVSRDAHFFEELGGHSLAAFEIFAEIETRLGVAMLLATLFQAPTVALLAAAVRRLKWKAPEHLRMLQPAEDGDGIETVLYLLNPEVDAAESTAGERVMGLGGDGRPLRHPPVSAWAREIAAFEAAGPLVALSAAAADEVVLQELKMALMAAGLSSVEVRLHR